MFEKPLLRHVHKVHSIGSSEVEGLQGIYPAAASVLLPYGFAWNHQAIRYPKNAHFTIGFVGRLDTHTKGLDLLAVAFYIFQQQHAEAQLWIIGEGEGKSALEKSIAERQLKNAVLWGKKFGHVKDVLLSQLHVFAHPSRNEGLPTAVLEAASLGTPVVVTQATNVAAYVTAFGAGVAIENDNVQALVAAFEQLYQAYQQGQAAAYVSGAEAMLRQVFSWPQLVEQYDDLYC